MKHLSIILTIVILSSQMACSDSKDNANSGDLTTNIDSGDTTTEINSSDPFLEIFPDISTDNLHIYSPCDRVDGIKYKGKPIDSIYYHYFLIDDFLKSRIQDSPAQLFSCYKFKLSAKATGLIVRAPSQYSETLIELYIWDNETKRLVDHVELADSFGDGAWYFVKDGWLLDLNNDGAVDLVRRKVEWWEDDDDKEHTADSLGVFLNVDNKFRKSEFYVDTAKFRVLAWDRH